MPSRFGTDMRKNIASEKAITESSEIAAPTITASTQAMRKAFCTSAELPKRNLALSSP